MLGLHMEAELREQAVVLPQQAPRYDDELARLLNGKSYDLVVIAARGSSDHAALFARYLIEIHLGIPVSLAAPSVITQFGGHLRYPGRVLGLGISQSGAAPDVAEVLAQMREAGQDTLAVTNTEGSRMTEVAEMSLALGVGSEQSIAATKTFTASLLAMVSLVRALGADVPSFEADSGWIETAVAFADQHAEPLLERAPLVVLGRGYAYPVALETALKLMECALIAAKAYSSADFEHGPRALAGPDAALLVVNRLSAPVGLPSHRLDWPEFAVPPEIAAIPQAIVGQAMALKLARLRGHDPDEAPRLMKVTKTT
jgi:glucosamine--fructose-6-phosphate aminotransferase (isomerizing)